MKIEFQKYEERRGQLRTRRRRIVIDLGVLWTWLVRAILFL